MMSKNPIAPVFGFLGGLLHTETQGGFLLFCVFFLPKSFSNRLFLSYLGISVINVVPRYFSELSLSLSNAKMNFIK